MDYHVISVTPMARTYELLGHLPQGIMVYGAMVGFLLFINAVYLFRTRPRSK